MPHPIDYAALQSRIAEYRGGEQRNLGRIDPKRTAHVIVDLQNGFMEEGAPVEVPAARGIVDNVNRLSGAVRSAGGTNIFLRYTTSDLDDGWSVMRERLGAGAAAHEAGFTAGTHYWELWPQLEISPEDLVIEKKRFSAFAAEASGLHETLQQCGIDTLIVSGTLTNCCCESTARDAMQYNYRVAMIHDANAALSDGEHEASLFSLGFIFADIFSTDEMETMLAEAYVSA